VLSLASRTPPLLIWKVQNSRVLGTAQIAGAIGQVIANPLYRSPPTPCGIEMLSLSQPGVGPAEAVPPPVRTAAGLLPEHTRRGRKRIRR
jgi:hypothetical protein